ncbi:MAG: hypothetical protein DWI57_15905 [Chloroflexi bacterium]|nr:MAG: hypothetical protein DWI57_15905 [Chloroflexota bacterium]
MIVIAVAAFIILFVATGYFLLLAWLLTLLAPLTFAQAAALSFLVPASGFVILARLPRFDLITIFMCALGFALLALVEVLLARLVVLITPLAVWEASLLMAGSASLLMFIIVQTILDSSNYEETESDDDEDDTTVVRRFSPDMYALRPRRIEPPPPPPARAPRGRPIVLQIKIFSAFSLVARIIPQREMENDYL